MLKKRKKRMAICMKQEEASLRSLFATSQQRARLQYIMNRVSRHASKQPVPPRAAAG